MPRKLLFGVLFATIGACASRSQGYIFGPSQANSSGSAVIWRSSDTDREVAPDSIQCASTAMQMAGSKTGDMYRSEFDRCITDRGWTHAVRFVGADTCAPVRISWLDPSLFPPPALDTLRRAMETRIAAAFFPSETLRELEARVAFTLEFLNDRVMVDPVALRVVTASGGSRFLVEDYERRSAAREPFIRAAWIELNWLPSDAAAALQKAPHLSGIAVLRARCLRDFKPK